MAEARSWHPVTSEIVLATANNAVTLARKVRIVGSEDTTRNCGSHLFPARFLKIPMVEGQGMKDVRRESVGRGHFVSRARRLNTDAAPQIRVTLSVDLLNHLRTEARSRHVPLRWLVAGLVCDTMKTEVEPQRQCFNRFC
jgi:hypothetical protein